ncbi:MAG: 3-hydroxybutyryl-CoA dehydrogenase [Gemmatimonadaceae bacterium]|nr:3-hydroxybutyryl-CoA dehydrogenase [Gemmatimonadaceae bacterium]
MVEIVRVGIVGGGLMGSGIAQVSALAGFDTVVREIDDRATERTRSAIERSLAKGVEKGKVDATDAQAAMGRLRVASDLEVLADRDLVLEAIVESLDAKQALWRALDPMVGAGAIFATNTSSLSVAEQAAVTRRADRFVGLHFFNPVPVLRLVEVVRSVATSEATLATATAWVRRLGKEPIVARDTPGFVVNLLLVPYMLDAIRAFEGGVASIGDIDRGMQLGAAMPSGPLALCDTVGLDTLERVADVMHRASGEPRHAPPALLHRLVQGGKLGRKSGCGFYDYTTDPPTPTALAG